MKCSNQAGECSDPNKECAKFRIESAPRSAGSSSRLATLNLGS